MPIYTQDTRGAFRNIITRLRERRAGTERAKKGRTPEAARVQAALELHELGVRLYRQRMHREHPQANRDEIDGMVRAWLAEPAPSGHLRLPSRERDRGIR